jgi:hypothetical protein
MYNEARQIRREFHKQKQGNKTMLNSTITTDTPTIDDSKPSLDSKLARQEQRNIVNAFQLDFGFSLDELPDLDLPIETYEKHLGWMAEDEQEAKEIKEEEEQAIILEMHETCPNWDDSTDTYDRILEEDKHAVAGLMPF